MGNLADLGLGDIFQIVSLSRRSGMLQLTTPYEAGEIVFHQGRVISVYRTETPEAVGEGLMALGVVSPAVYQDLLAAEAAGARGPEVFQKAGLSTDAVEEALEELTKRGVYAMFEWEEGTFSFVLEDEPDPWRGFSIGGTRVVAQRGLNPQYLAIEGARVRDERAREDTLTSFLARDKPRQPAVRARGDVQDFAAKLREAAELPVSPADDELSEKVIPFPSGRVRPSAPAPAPAVSLRAARGSAEPAVRAEPKEAPPATWEASSRTLFVVDDDPHIVRQIATRFEGRFATVLTAGSVGAALDQLDAHAANGVVACDLIIPRSDGGGILGGIEILEKLSARSPPIPVVLFTDYENDEAQARAVTLGARAFLSKPRKAQLQSEGRTSGLMRTFLDDLDQALALFADADATSRPPVAASAPRKEGDDYDLRSEIGVDADGGVEREGLPPRLDSREPVGTLRSMLAELVDPANRETATLLVLRYATLVFERAALFLVTRRAFAGLGGFSLEESSDRFVARVRRINIPLATESILAKVLQYRATVRTTLGDAPGNKQLIEAMGGTWPQGDAAALPLVSGDRVAAVLYGDAPTGKTLGPIDTLEIFLQQAGVVMDRALLERRLEEWRGKQDVKE